MLLQDSVLEVLGGSTMLEHLDIYQGDSLGDLSLSALSLNAFPALRHLGLLNFSDDRAIRDFYEVLPGTINRLTSLEIQYYNKYRGGGGPPMTSLVSLICGGSPHLTDLSLQLTHGYIWQMSPEILEALAVLPLRRLCIVAASINDVRLDSLAVLFPHLKSLRLPHHQIQLLELRELVQKTPRLECLGIALPLELVPDDVPAMSYPSALRVIESDFKDETGTIIGPALWDWLTYARCRKLTQFFYALSPKVRLVPKAYFIGPERNPVPPSWVISIGRLVDWMNNHLSSLPPMPFNQADFYEEDFNCWVGCFVFA
ncbi:hypothetical protein FRC08_003930 [Ceratobasidium sp. 394]|nr:hypothetical protein FRC08_003930 [Ceratobasidium sp. 394]